MDFSVFEHEGWPWWSSPFNGQSRRLSNFYVVGSHLRPRFGFDIYPGSTVGPEIVPAHVDISLWMPDESHEHETGAVRGTGYVFSKSALQLIPPGVLGDLKLREHKL